MLLDHEILEGTRYPAQGLYSTLAHLLGGIIDTLFTIALLRIKSEEGITFDQSKVLDLLRGHVSDVPSDVPGLLQQLLRHSSNTAPSHARYYEIYMHAALAIEMHIEL